VNMCACCKRQPVAIGNCCVLCYRKLVPVKFQVKEAKPKRKKK
jgi:hypothetical protein